VSAEAGSATRVGTSKERILARVRAALDGRAPTKHPGDFAVLPQLGDNVTIDSFIRNEIH
jgi:hypothetical protein